MTVGALLSLPFFREIISFGRVRNDGREGERKARRQGWTGDDMFGHDGGSR